MYRISLFSLLCVSAFAEDLPEPSFQVITTPADAALQPAEDGKFWLPTIEVPVILSASCTGNQNLPSVSLGVSDVDKSFTARQLQESNPLETILRIPSNQLAPLASDAFCNDTVRSKLVEAAYTMQASMRCTYGDDETVVYRSVPVDVNLVCPQVESPEEDESEADEPSS